MQILLILSSADPEIKWNTVRFGNFSRIDFDSYPVSTRVNNTRNDFPELLVPLKA